MKVPLTLRKMAWNLAVKAKLLPGKAPFIWPVNVDGLVQWQMGNFLSYVEDGFALNSIIYATIMYKVRAITQATARAYVGDPTNPELLPATHPLSVLASRPNPYMSWMEMQSLLETYLNISGNAYLVIDRRNADRGVPSALWPIAPDEMFIIPKEGDLQGYLYVPRTSIWTDGIPILAEDIIHVKFPNPMDNFEGLGYGLSPMSPLAQSGDIDNQATRFLKLFFERGAMPAGLLKYDIPLDKDLIGEIKARWRMIYGGVDNWTDIGILDSGADYQKLSQNFQEMGFEALDERNEARIVAPFGVPPILIGTRYGIKHATYSNYEEARKAFWEDTMLYEIRLFETEMQHHLRSDDGAYLRYDVSQVPALRLDAAPMVDAAQKLWSMGMPLNQALRTVGLHVPEVEGGDIAYIGGQVREVGTPPIGQQQPAKTNPVVDLQGKVLKALERKRRQSKAMRTVMDDWTETFTGGARKALKADRDELLALCTEVAGKAVTAKASINWRDILEPYTRYLEEEGMKRWSTIFRPMMAAEINDAGKFWSAELGTSFNIRNITAEEWFQSYNLEFAQPINDTTKAFVHELIAQAQEEGWSNQVLQKHIQQVFQEWMDGGVDPDTWEWLNARIPDYRAEAIARTETMRSANGGSQALFADWGVKTKTWDGTDDGRERDSHIDANGQTVKVDEDFDVGGYSMSFPGDASKGAPPEEYVNCRCAMLPGDDEG